jgi:hypothetical protein
MRAKEVTVAQFFPSACALSLASDECKVPRSSSLCSDGSENVYAKKITDLSQFLIAGASRDHIAAVPTLTPMVDADEKKRG